MFGEMDDGNMVKKTNGINAVYTQVLMIKLNRIRSSIIMYTWQLQTGYWQNIHRPMTVPNVIG